MGCNVCQVELFDLFIDYKYAKHHNDHHTLPMRHKQSKPNSRGCCLALLFASWFHDAYLRTALNGWWESQLKLMFTASNPHLARRAEKVLHPSGTQREQQENLTKAPATAPATATWCLVPGAGCFQGRICNRNQPGKPTIEQPTPLCPTRPPPPPSTAPSPAAPPPSGQQPVASGLFLLLLSISDFIQQLRSRITSLALGWLFSVGK